MEDRQIMLQQMEARHHKESLFLKKNFEETFNNGFPLAGQIVDIDRNMSMLARTGQKDQLKVDLNRADPWDQVEDRKSEQSVEEDNPQAKSQRSNLMLSARIKKLEESQAIEDDEDEVGFAEKMFGGAAPNIDFKRRQTDQIFKEAEGSSKAVAVKMGS
jgi:hypothetical protein